MGPDDKVRAVRWTKTLDPEVRAAPEGIIDPLLKTIGFWNQDRKIACLHYYAVHPTTVDGTGVVTPEFVGLARNQRSAADKGVPHIYFTGCAGNITAGKYNTGARTNRVILANRLYDGMKGAWENTKRQPLRQIQFRNVEMRLKPRNHPGFTEKDFKAKLVRGGNHWHQCLAAMGLSWRQRCERGQPVDLPVIDFGPAQLLLLPGESYVEYQLAAQKMRPGSFVLVAGYGEGGTGYVPTEKHWEEKDGNLGDWCWVHPGSEKVMLKAIRAVLTPR